MLVIATAILIIMIVPNVIFANVIAIFISIWKVKGRRGKGMSPRRSGETIMLSISKTFFKKKTNLFRKRELIPGHWMAYS